MRVLTVSELKSDKSNSGVKSDYPKHGTFAWEILNELKANEGHAVDLSILAHSKQVESAAKFHTALARLRDMYGMDIRKVKKRQYLYVLAGEWVGSRYHDFCAREFHSGNRS